MGLIPSRLLVGAQERSPHSKNVDTSSGWRSVQMLLEAKEHLPNAGDFTQHRCRVLDPMVLQFQQLWQLLLV